jgi:hypothetical protein
MAVAGPGITCGGQLLVEYFEQTLVQPGGDHPLAKPADRRLIRHEHGFVLLSRWHYACVGCLILKGGYSS